MGGAGRKDQRHIEVHITSNIYQQSWKDPEKCTKTHVYIHTNTHIIDTPSQAHFSDTSRCT